MVCRRQWCVFPVCVFIFACFTVLRSFSYLVHQWRSRLIISWIVLASCTAPYTHTYKTYTQFNTHTLIYTRPFTHVMFLSLYLFQASLGWVYLFMGILVGSAVIPITLAMFWERLTSGAMMAGSIGGAVMAISVWLGVASTYEGGLGSWWTNTGRLKFCCQHGSYIHYILLPQLSTQQEIALPQKTWWFLQWSLMCWCLLTFVA